MTPSLLQQAVEALKTCDQGGYRDVDGDWCKTYWYDVEKVKAAIASLEAAIQQQPEPASQYEDSDPGDCPELNMSNYGHDDVDTLNAWAIQADACIERLTHERNELSTQAQHARAEMREAHAAMDVAGFPRPQPSKLPYSLVGRVRAGTRTAIQQQEEPVARVRVTDAGWAQLWVRGVPIQSGYGQGAKECCDRLAAQINAGASPPTIQADPPTWRAQLSATIADEDHAELVKVMGDDPAIQQPAPDALAEMMARKDAAYEERNKVVAALAKLFPSGIARTAIEGWSEDWHGCVYIDLPTGQVSWHFHDSQAHLFAGLPPYTKAWDGHDTPEKYRRLAAIQQQEEPNFTCQSTTADGRSCRGWCGDAKCASPSPKGTQEPSERNALLAAWRAPEPVYFEFDKKKPKPDGFAAYTVLQLHRAFADGVDAASPKGNAATDGGKEGALDLTALPVVACGYRTERGEYAAFPGDPGPDCSYDRLVPLSAVETLLRTRGLDAPGEGQR